MSPFFLANAVLSLVPGSPTSTTRSGLDVIADSILVDEGLRLSIPRDQIVAGAEAADGLSALILAGVRDLGLLSDRLIDSADVLALNAWFRADPARYDAFVALHGDDEDGEETGYHQVQGDGAWTGWFGRNLVNTIGDGLFHIGFEVVNGRFQNEDGDANATVADVASWLDYFLSDVSNTGTGLDDITDAILTDRGLAGGTAASQIMEGARTANTLNKMMLQGLAATGGNTDGRIDVADILALNTWFRADTARYDAFVALHGDDENGVETGFHTVQGDGGRSTYLGQNLINTVVDGLFHIGFEIQASRFLNEDGDANADIGDVATWLNFLLNGKRLYEGSDLGTRFDTSTLDDTVHAGAGNDAVSAKEGDDSIDAGEGNDWVDAGDGNDRVDGGKGDDDLNGNLGNDILRAGDGSDRINGGDGRDRILGEGGNDQAWGGIGNDEMRGGSGNDSLDGQLGEDRLFGDAGDDRLSGGYGLDTLSGGDGNDMLDGGDSDDTLAGDAGLDQLNGGNGNDSLAGGLDADTLSGGAGDDRMDGGDGADKLWGGTGRDTMLGGAGDDQLGGNEDNDRIDAGDGNDTVWGGTGNDRADGGAGDDQLFGELGDDSLAGGDGSDSLYGSDGNDTASGGADNDTLDGGAGTDQLLGDAGADTLWGSSGNDSLAGGADNDSLAGGDEDDMLFGGSGDDRLSGGAGADRLEGGFGADSLSGGSGGDRLVSRSDAGEPVPAGGGAPVLAPLGLAANDTLSGGTESDIFRFELWLNAPAAVLGAHLKPDGSIDWAGVATENGSTHASWVEGIGDDIITDFRKSDGDRIEIAGFSVAVARIDYRDVNGDGVKESVILLASEQGASGAHDGDALGSITVFGDKVLLADIALDATATHAGYTRPAQGPWLLDDPAPFG